MIQIGSFLHRNELADVIGRAIEDRLRPEDAQRLKTLVNLNSYVLRVYSSLFAEALFRHVQGDFATMPARTKGELKDLITANTPVRTNRIDELVSQYRKFPQDYYRETPYEGTMYVKAGDPPLYVGSRRIKRVRRIAEKCGRRLIDYMFEQVRQRADELAVERACKAGVPKEQLVTPPEEMVAEFRHAERRVMKSIRDGLFVAAMPQFYIDDVVGIRIVTTPESSRRFEEFLASCEDLSIVDEKRFSGRFNGRNMVVAWRLPRDELLRTPPPEAALQVLLSRGVGDSRQAVLDRYSDFVLFAEGHVRFEILLIDYEQLLESEIGQSMHEEHILELRDKQGYHGRLAQNVEALMIYLFGFALSARHEIPELPIKIGGTYLPDYFDGVLRSLWETQTGSLGLTL